MAINLANKGTITVKTAREGDNAIRVSVTDTSADIEKEALSKLFHQFDETGKKRDREAGGTGLGLAISRAIIEMHRGKIWAESVQGGGTAFCFVLPLSERRK
jgi:two-component system sensor histidine kinase VicK